MGLIMKYCSQHWLDRRCPEAGYNNGDCHDCIIKHGEVLTVDENHPKYPVKANKNTLINSSISGVGTEIKQILSKIDIVATENCSCNAKAKLMDSNGIEWCENNIDTIVGWLREEANKRKLPFIDIAGKILVKKAIKNARKNQKK